MKKRLLIGLLLILCGGWLLLTAAGKNPPKPPEVTNANYSVANQVGIALSACKGEGGTSVKECSDALSRAAKMSKEPGAKVSAVCTKELQKASGLCLYGLSQGNKGCSQELDLLRQECPSVQTHVVSANGKPGQTTAKSPTGTKPGAGVANGKKTTAPAGSKSGSGSKQGSGSKPDKSAKPDKGTKPDKGDKGNSGGKVAKSNTGDSGSEDSGSEAQQIVLPPMKKKVCWCTTETATFKSQVAGIQIDNSNESVANARFRDGRLEIEGKDFGKTTITVSGELVRYNMGFPDVPQPKKGIHGGGVNSIPLNGNQPFTQKIEVTVRCNLTGKWKGPAGTYTITQSCNKGTTQNLTLKAGKAIYTGSVDFASKKIKLSHVLSYDETETVDPGDAAIDQEVRQKMIAKGTKAIIEANVSDDENSFSGDFITEKPNIKKVYDQDNKLLRYYIDSIELVRQPVSFTRKQKKNQN